MKQLLTGNNNHVFVCGLTRSGKTYFIKNAAAALPYPVLFFNPQNESLPSCFLQVNENADFTLVQKHLKNGGKIDFRFTVKIRHKEIMAIIGYCIKQLMQNGFNQNNPIYIVVDEAQLLSGYGLDMTIDAATRGLSRGVRLICISQRPALVNKTIYTQALEQYIFRLHDGESAYMKTKGIDFDFCKKQWEELGQYSYIYSNGFETKGNKAI